MQNLEGLLSKLARRVRRIVRGGVPGAEKTQETVAAAQATSPPTREVRAGRRIRGKVISVSERQIVGWCFSPSDPEPCEVILLLDGVEINRTWATQQIQNGAHKGRWIRFRFGMSNIWNLCAPGQKLSIKTEGRLLPFRGQTEFDVLPPTSNAPERHITDLLDSGMVINKFGKVHTPRTADAKWMAKSHGHYSSILKTLMDEFAIECFALYGVCLGFAREGKIMRHDLDLDLGYLSSQNTPEKVREEFEQITRFFISVNPATRPATYKIRFAGSSISLTPSWFDESGRFFTTFGFVGPGGKHDELVPSDVIPAQTVPWFDDKTVTLPANPARVARYLYGPYWMYPDTGWKWFSGYRRRPEIAAAKLSEDSVSALEEFRLHRWNADSS